MKELLLVTAVASFFSVAHGQCKPSFWIIASDNIKDISSYVHPNLEIVDETIMHFKQANNQINNEKLLEVPLTELNTRSTVRITVGIQPPNPLTTDNDPTLGLTDGQYTNRIRIHDQGNYNKHPPCMLMQTLEQMKTLVASDSPAPSQFTFIFRPQYRYGACYTAQNDGYVNIGMFSEQLEASKPLSLVLFRHDKQEEYKFYYIMVEAFEDTSAALLQA